MRAGQRTDGISNKILWVVREPRNGRPLVVTARSSNAQTAPVSFEANSSPGEIYPSSVDVPTAGCWVLTLQWGPHRGTVRLEYSP